MHSLTLLLKKKLKLCQTDKEQNDQLAIRAGEALEGIRAFFNDGDDGVDFPARFFAPLEREFEPREDTSEWLDGFEWFIQDALEVRMTNPNRANIRT